MTTATITDITAEIERLEADLDRVKKDRDHANALFHQQKDKAYARLDGQTFFFYATGGEQFTVRVSLKKQWGWGRDYHKKTRIYTSGVNLDKIEEEARPHYVAVGEQSAEYKKAGRAHRAEEHRIITAALAEIGIKFEKVNFSQKAGCSCPCSPGWIANDILTIDGFRIDDLYVSQVRNADGEVK
jgi:hypothetical protein